MMPMPSIQEDPYHERAVIACLWQLAEAVDVVLFDSDDEGLAKAMIKLDRAFTRLRDVQRGSETLKRDARLKAGG